ncbi:hypothetical protein GCM10025857_23540 [Alicyclobacillus contaminans]|nr:hypothetical protein GCM10025857_23540 [Alicyclobacillus contaminans]
MGSPEVGELSAGESDFPFWCTSDLPYYEAFLLMKRGSAAYLVSTGSVGYGGTEDKGLLPTTP